MTLMNKAKISKIGQAIAEISTRISVAKYKNLRPDEISEKACNDYVTAVDLEIQKDLTEKLEELYPNSVFISEEMAQEYNPEEIKELSKTRHVWIIDPLDGTGNFVKGNPNFRTAVALIKDGEAKASWIHSPLNNETLCALKDGGAWDLSSGKSLKVRSAEPERRPSLDVNSDVKNIYKDNYDIRCLHCRSATYGALAKGELDGAVFTKELKWWDHIPGTLIHSEAGGVNAMINGEKYGLDTNTRNLISANDATLWRDLQKLGRPHLMADIEPGRNSRDMDNDPDLNL